MVPELLSGHSRGPGRGDCGGPSRDALLLSGWLPCCKKLLQDNFAQAAIAEKTRKSFDVIAINMWGDREVTRLNGEAMTEKAFAKRVRVMFTPTLVMLDEDGEVALRINGYSPPIASTRR